MARKQAGRRDKTPVGPPAVPIPESYPSDSDTGRSSLYLAIA